LVACAAAIGVAVGVAVKVGVGLGVEVGVAVGVTVAVAVGVGEGVPVGVGVGGGVTVGVGVGVGLGATSQAFGPRMATVAGVPVLKNPIVALVAIGGLLESNRKLYKVPQRRAFAFWFCAKISVFQLTALTV
jgi:hypothetical protein